MDFIIGLISTITVATSLAGRNYPVSDTYRRNVSELSACLKNKGIDPSKNEENRLANIELLTLAHAQKLDKETEFFIENSRVLTDFDDNPFVLVELNRGFGVYSVLNHVFAEMTVTGEGNPYGEYLKAKKRLKYVWLNDYYVEKDPKEYIGLRGGTKIVEYEDIESLRERSRSINWKFMEMHDKYNEEYVVTNTEHIEITTLFDDGFRGGGRVTKTPFDDQIWYNAEVPYSWYFKKNKDGFPHNGKGTCGHVALTMLLAYNEFFRCAGYFSDEESAKYITPAVAPNNVFGEAVPKIPEDFQYYAWGSDIGGSTSWIIKAAADSFLKGKKVKYSHYNRIWEFGSVMEPIDRGFPAILFGQNFPNPNPTPGQDKITGFHAVVAYAYHKIGLPSGSAVYKLTCHYGWETSGAQEMVIPLPAFWDQGSIYSLFNESEHICKGYFLQQYGRTVRCGCGNVLVV